MHIDHYANNSRMSRTHPAFKLSFGLSLMIMILVVDRWAFSLGGIVLCSILLRTLGKTPLRVYFRTLLTPLVFILVSMLTIALSVRALPSDLGLGAVPQVGLSSIGHLALRQQMSSQSGTGAGILFVLLRGHTNGLVLTMVGTHQALSLGSRAFGAVSALLFISYSTPLNDCFSQLRRLHLPMVLVTLMALIYRFLFLILDSFQALIHAQSLRLGYRRLRTGLRSLGTAMGLLFSRVFYRSDMMEEALSCRLYQGSLLTLDPVYEKGGARGIILLVLTVIVLGAGLALRLS